MTTTLVPVEPPAEHQRRLLQGKRHILLLVSALTLLLGTLSPLRAQGNRTDTTGPAVAITSHTNNQSVNTSSITVAGTATDNGRGNNGISSVTVNGLTATAGTVSGGGTGA